MRNRFLLLLLALLIVGTACNRDPNVAKKRFVESGNKYYEKAKYKEALIMYRKALQKDMRFGEAYYRSALAEVKLGRYSDAVRDLQRAVELQPENLDAHTRLTNLFLNAYLADRRRPQEYIDEMRAIRDRMNTRFPGSYELERLNGYIALAEAKPK
ncbi:MAG: tetratricopeptide repeat protein, partial [Bryobacteraceae bacterium]